MKINFWTLFRLIFVVFFLYLVGDAFYRWDAFRYYGSFWEFLPGVALISVLWSFASFFSALCIWLLFKIIQWTFCKIKLIVSMEQFLSCLVLFVLLGGTILIVKRLLWPYAHTSSYLKLGILTIAALSAIFLTWVFRARERLWVAIIHERITPLVWLFGALVILFVPLVAYISFSKQIEYDYPANTATPQFSSVDRNRPNILLITFDALTARDMSVYGFGKETTPFISEWAKSASLFTRNEAAGNYTAPATASIMTGKRIWTHRRFQSNAGAPVKSESENFPLLLKRSGYFNMAFVANNLASVQELGMVSSFMIAPLSIEFMEPVSLYGALGYYLYKFFSEKIRMYYWLTDEDFILYKLLPDNYVKYPYKTEFPIEKVIDKFMAELGNGQQRPYFTWLHLFPPHAPYLPPDEYSGLFDQSSRFREWKDQYPLVRQRYFAKDRQSDAYIMRSRYDEFIRYCDSQFQELIDLLENKMQLKNTVIILSSDHGESFEHGYFTHGGPLLFEQMTHVPLIIKEPGQVEGKVVNVVTEQVDIPATILDLAGIPVPSWMEGTSLVPLLRGSVPEPGPAFSMNFDTNPALEKIKKGTIAIWDREYKLIHYLETDKSLLFNITNDPGEQNNLIDKQPDVGERLLGLIKDELEKVNKRYPVTE